MLKTQTLTQEMVDVLKLLASRANMVIIGEMGKGKITMAKWLLGFVPDDLVVGTLETTFEMHLRSYTHTSTGYSLRNSTTTACMTCLR